MNKEERDPLTEKIIACAFHVHRDVVFEYQILSYLKATGLSVGLIINFGNKSCEVRRLNYSKKSS
ncbi:MAG: hypothetical protein HYY40_14935 [Bacteroidetes bacterium]|nr:hypothetical protein [Bacteroidota bacterium]